MPDLNDRTIEGENLRWRAIPRLLNSVAASPTTLYSAADEDLEVVTKTRPLMMGSRAFLDPEAALKWPCVFPYGWSFVPNRMAHRIPVYVCMYACTDRYRCMHDIEYNSRAGEANYTMYGLARQAKEASKQATFIGPNPSLDLEASDRKKLRIGSLSSPHPSISMASPSVQICRFCVVLVLGLHLKGDGNEIQQEDGGQTEEGGEWVGSLFLSTELLMSSNIRRQPQVPSWHQQPPGVQCERLDVSSPHPLYLEPGIKDRPGQARPGQGAGACSAASWNCYPKYCGSSGVKTQQGAHTYTYIPAVMLVAAPPVLGLLV